MGVWVHLSPRPDQKLVENRVTFLGSNSMFQGLPECLSSEKAWRREYGPCECGVTRSLLRKECRASGWGGEVAGMREVKGQPFNDESELALVAPKAI